MNDASPTTDIDTVPARLVAGERLSEDESCAVFEALLNGELDEARIGGILALIQARGATADELVGAARAMRDHVTPVPYTPEEGESLIDTCGTGGVAKTFNVSTAAAIVAAASVPGAASGVSRVVVVINSPMSTSLMNSCAADERMSTDSSAVERS